MYSVVLMMAMTTAPETPNCHWASCHGCYSTCFGCYGGYYSSGYGGGWGHNLHHGNCWGGYYSCHGCFGGMYVPYSCQGYGIYGGTSYSWPTYYPGGCGGCYGYGYPVPVYPPPPKVIIDEKDKKDREPKKTMLPLSPDAARVVVHLPADAKLYANGQLTNLTSSERTFTTPTLEKGRDFQYALKVEYARGGQTVTDTRTIRVRAGEASFVAFGAKAETVTSSIRFLAPEGASVYVDSSRRALPAGTREFKTPDLAVGARYAYQFRAEVTKNGKKFEQTQRIVFKAGEPVTVDFSDIDSLRTASK